MTKLLTITFCLLFALAYSQSERMSEHKITFNINEKQKEIKNSRLFIIIESDTINGNKINDKYYFPYIEKEFTIVIKINNTEFKAGPFEPNVLNSGSDLDLGIINNIKKMISVAKRNEMNKFDKDYELYSKRYFIVNGIYTIDIEDAEKIKVLHYLVVDGKSKSSEKLIETNILVQRNIKVKN